MSSASSDSKGSFVEPGHLKEDSTDAEPEKKEPGVQTHMYQNQKTTEENVSNQHKEKSTTSQNSPPNHENPSNTNKEGLNKIENISASSEKQKNPLSHDTSSKLASSSDEVKEETMTKTDMLSDCSPKESIEANEDRTEVVLETKLVRTKKITRIARRKTPNKNQEMVMSKKNQ